jgi:hypothetical protein
MDRRRYQMSRAAERDLAYRIACLPLPAPVPRNIDLSLEYGREPSAADVAARELATVRPGLAVAS